MTSSPTASHASPRVPLTEDAKKREAIVALEAVLATVEQQRPVLSPWECFHFRCGLNAFLAGDYKTVWIEAEDALIPFAERTSAAKAKLRAAGPLGEYDIARLRAELAHAKAEAHKP